MSLRSRGVRVAGAGATAMTATPVGCTLAPMNLDPAASDPANNVDYADGDDIPDRGERVSHLRPDAGYLAHLSIYDYALSQCQDARVLDAGSGAGYGAAYLASHGARQVDGVDVSPKAVAFSRHHFRQTNLAFHEMSLEHLDGFPAQHFSFIYTSNTLEHVPNILPFLAAANHLLRPGGTLLAAVPPITDDRLLYLNLINPYHVNIWSPRQWAYALGLFFEDLQPVLHGVVSAGADFKPEHFTPSSTLTEKSFVFTPGTVADMYQTFTLTAIFVAKNPRPISQLPDSGAPPRFVDESFTRPVGQIDPNLRLRLKSFFEMPSPPFALPAENTSGSSRLGRKLKSAWRALVQRQA
jgi:SAM-dependent methyltransferase